MIIDKEELLSHIREIQNPIYQVTIYHDILDGTVLDEEEEEQEVTQKKN